MKIAYLTLVHRNPKLLGRLIQILSTEDSGFFIHVDRKSNISDFSSIKGKDIHLIQERRSVFWGEFSQVEASLDLIRIALRSDVQYEYFVLLHGSDYPLRSSNYIDRFFEENNGLEFISAVKMPAPGFPLFKINKVRYPSDKPIRRFVSRLVTKVGLGYRDYRKSLPGMAAYGGDACWALSRNACEYVMEFVGDHPEILRYFARTLTSDEMFFHTILGNSSFRGRMRKSILYTDWPELGNHPNEIGEKNLTFFEGQEKVWTEDQFGAGEALFARKFSDNRLDLLDRMDEMIRGKEVELSQLQLLAGIAIETRVREVPDESD